MQMHRTRVIFIAIVGLALIIACVAGALTMFSNNAATPTPVAQVATTAATTASPTRPSTNLQSPEPIWGPNYDANDGLPTYICGADAFGSYFTLQQMQMAGIDKANGFHLGIVPFALDGDPKYEISEEQRTALLNSGVWDCLLTTLDSVCLLYTSDAADAI